MAPFRDALQQAIEPSKPLFEFVRMLLSFYVLLGLTFLLAAHWKSITGQIHSVGWMVAIGGAFGMICLNLLCFGTLFSVCRRLSENWGPEGGGKWRAVLRAALSLLMFIALTGIPALLAVLAFELNRASLTAP